MADTDTDYFLNRNRFEDEFAEFYGRFGLQPRQILQFPVVLPFHLPFPGLVSVSYELDNAVCTLAFQTISTTSAFHAGLVGSEEMQIPLHRTQVEMNFVTAQQRSLQREVDGLSDVFDTLVYHLNLLITAYLLLHDDTTAHTVSKEMFEAISLARYIEIDGWKTDSIVFLQHLNVPFRGTDLTKAQLEQTLWYSHVVRAGMNPFMLTKETKLSARRALNQGRYQECAVFAQTAVETFLASLLVKLLVAEGKTVPEAESKVEEIPFVRRVKKEFHPRIGGRWDVTAGGTPVSDWYQETYGLRNRVIHAGHVPSFEEAGEALAAAEVFIASVVELVQAKTDEYPGLMKFFAEPEVETSNGA